MYVVLKTQIRFGPITGRGPVFTRPFLVDVKKTLCGEVGYECEMFSSKKRLKYVFGVTALSILDIVFFV